MIMPRVAYVLVSVLLASAPVNAQSPTPVGTWLHPNQRIKIQIAPCNGRLCGKLVWFRWPNDKEGEPLEDVKNGNPALRGRPLLGLTVLRGLRRSGPRTWKDGKIYNPDDGLEYNAIVTMRDDGTLSVRAYVVMPVLGKTLNWTRVR